METFLGQSAAMFLRLLTVISVAIAVSGVVAVGIVATDVVDKNPRFIVQIFSPRVFECRNLIS